MERRTGMTWAHNLICLYVPFWHAVIAAICVDKFGGNHSYTIAVAGTFYIVAVGTVHTLMKDFIDGRVVAASGIPHSQRPPGGDTNSTTAAQKSRRLRVFETIFWFIPGDIREGFFGHVAEESAHAKQSRVFIYFKATLQMTVLLLKAISPIILVLWRIISQISRKQ